VLSGHRRCGRTEFCRMLERASESRCLKQCKGGTRFLFLGIWYSLENTLCYLHFLHAHDRIQSARSLASCEPWSHTPLTVTCSTVYVFCIYCYIFDFTPCYLWGQYMCVSFGYTTSRGTSSFDTGSFLFRPEFRFVTSLCAFNKLLSQGAYMRVFLSGTRHRGEQVLSTKNPFSSTQI